MCGAVAGGVDLDGLDSTTQAVIQGIVLCGGEPVVPAYVRLLDASGEFTAELPTSESGRFRFFAAPGEWTVRVLAPGGSADRPGVDRPVVDRLVHARLGAVSDLEVHV